MKKEYLRRLENNIDDDVNVVVDFPANEYWILVGKPQTLSEKGLENFKRCVDVNGCINKHCARTIRKVNSCKHCIHFYECLENGEMIK